MHTTIWGPLHFYIAWLPLASGDSSKHLTQTGKSKSIKIKEKTNKRKSKTKFIPISCSGIEKEPQEAMKLSSKLLTAILPAI